MFDLAEPLAAKNDPKLIADDERHLAAIADTLTARIADLTRRLDEARRRPGGRGRQAVDRDDEVRRLSGQLRTLRRYRLDLCLGRMVAADGTTAYVGRLGLVDERGERLLVDWRSPAAEPFFGATHAQPMGLASRRRYRWTHGRVTDYWDEVFAPDAIEGHAALDDQSAFIASLGGNRSARMRDVLGTIQADQDAIIRAGSRGALVVDGGPGTGKTVVALHRTAYLRYHEPHRDVLLVGPHRPYLSYVADVLPGLGEHDVQTCTLRDLLPEGADAGPETDPEVARLKAGGRMIDAVEAAVRFHEEPPKKITNIDDLHVRPDHWAEAFAGRDLGVPHNEARDQIGEELIEVLAADDDDLRADLSRSTELRAALRRAWPMLRAEDVVGDLWSVPAYLSRCAPWLTAAEVAALQRPDAPQSWTAADLPLLDAARLLLGDENVSTVERVRKATERTERQRMSRVIDDLLEAHTYDDGEGLLSMLRQPDLHDTLVDTDAMPVAASDRLAGPFAHIVVDEAQELTDAQWRMLIRRCPSRSFTVVGDRAQARAGFTESWEQRLARVGLGHVTVATLTINYRTPEEVMAEAEPVIRAAVPDANVPVSIRRSGLPAVRGKAVDLHVILERAEGIACVIGDPAVPDTERVRSLTPELTKGLEFDLVVLVDPEQFSPVDRYVAMTRATRQLVLLER